MAFSRVSAPIHPPKQSRDDGDPCAVNRRGGTVAIPRLFWSFDAHGRHLRSPCQFPPTRPRAGRGGGDRLPACRAGAARGPDKIADVAEAVIDAVVNISTSQTVAAGGPHAAPTAGPARQRGRPQLPPGSPFEEFFEEFFKNRRGQGGRTKRRASARRAASIRSAPASSSMPAGIVVTNNHVIADADEITVVFNDGSQAQGRADRQGHQDRSRGAAREARQAAQGGEVRRLRQAAARRMGDRDRQSVQPRRLGDGRHRLGAQPRHQFGPVRQLHPDRRRHQPRQFRRAAVQPRRRGDRRQHRDHLAVRRLDRHRLRGAVEDRDGGDRPAARVRAKCAAAGSACASSR